MRFFDKTAFEAKGQSGLHFYELSSGASAA
jgi:hypothetical protein